MSRANPNGASQPDVPLSIAIPTEAEVRAADLEQEDAAVREAQAAQREARIREAAYDEAQRRGFLPGHEQQDWLEAERKVDRGDLEPSGPAKRGVP